MRNIILGAGLAMLLAPSGVPARPIDQFVTGLSRDERQVMAEFQTRVDLYVELHRQIARRTPSLVVSDDWSMIKDATDALAGGIRTARAAATHGVVFTPSVERWFRMTLIEYLGCGRPDDFLADIDDDDSDDFVLVPTVNGRWPNGAALPSMPTDLLAVLPPLPEGLQYRFMNRDLILWDVDANLVVDIVKGAVQ